MPNAKLPIAIRGLIPIDEGYANRQVNRAGQVDMPLACPIL
jgi:hypothetical protein